MSATGLLEEYCQRRDWDIIGCYVDNGISGSKESQPELDRLKADPRRRHFSSSLRAQGGSWGTIHRETGIGKGTAPRAFYCLVQFSSAATI